MSRAVTSGTINITSAATGYSSGATGVQSNGVALDIGAAERLQLVVKVSGSNSATITLQGGFQSASNTDSNWTDTALAATVTSGTQGQIGPSGGDGTIFTAWPFYRVKFTTTGSSTIQFAVVGIGGIE